MPGKTALVLCGGGSRGVAEVGFYKAIVELGIPVDFILGASVGAVNGAFIAGGLKPEDLMRLWLGFEKWKPFRFNWKILWRFLKVEGLLDPSGFRRFLEDTLPFTRFEDLKIPLTVVATNLTKAEPIYFEKKGDLITPIMASIALPLYFPSVPWNGFQLVDGGITNNAPIDAAVQRGATRILSFVCDCEAELLEPAKTFLQIYSRAFHVSIKQKLYHDMKFYKDKVELIVLAPCLLAARGVLDFSQTEKVMEQAYAVALSELSRLKAASP